MYVGIGLVGGGFQGAVVHGEALGSLVYYLLQYVVAESLLEFQLGFAGAHLLCPYLYGHARNGDGGYLPEGRVGNQFLKHLGKLLIVVRANFIKFRIHNLLVLNV